MLLICISCCFFCRWGARLLRILAGLWGGRTPPPTCRGCVSRGVGKCCPTVMQLPINSYLIQSSRVVLGYFGTQDQGLRSTFICLSYCESYHFCMISRFCENWRPQKKHALQTLEHIKCVCVQLLCFPPRFYIVLSKCIINLRQLF